MPLSLLLQFPHIVHLPVSVFYRMGWFDSTHSKRTRVCISSAPHSACSNPPCRLITLTDPSHLTEPPPEATGFVPRFPDDATGDLQELLVLSETSVCTTRCRQRVWPPVTAGKSRQPHAARSCTCSLVYRSAIFS